MPQAPPDAWLEGDRYEPYIGRWSRLVAKPFVAWLDAAPALDWLDIGCGTGALSEAILAGADPGSVTGIDPSEAFVRHARAHVVDRRAAFEVGQAQALPFGADRFDLAVSGLVLNFVPDPPAALQEMRRVLRPDGAAALYVWDYAAGMELLRHFWDAAIALDPGAVPLDEAGRFPICDPDRLEALFRATGFQEVEVRAIDITTDFRDFDDYWRPFLGGQGPAPTYLMSLGEDRRESLRRRIENALPIGGDGAISLRARAWAVSGRVP